MIEVEVQYFNGCPNSDVLIENVKHVITHLDIEINYVETLVNTNQIAQAIKFRGSPTLLINGKDFEYADEPDKANLSCRYYPQGVPTKEQIRERLLNEVGLK